METSADPFNCPTCGAHDYGLYLAVVGGCIHCMQAELERLRESERYAWKNTGLLDAERMRFRSALEQITRIGPLGVDTYPECYRRMHDIAVEALSAVSARTEPAE